MSTSHVMQRLAHPGATAAAARVGVLAGATLAITALLRFVDADLATAALALLALVTLAASFGALYGAVAVVCATSSSLDLMLPGIDGVEVLARIRSFSDVPVIVLIVRDSEHDKLAALDAGADDHVTKPFDSDELLARVAPICARAPARAGGHRRRVDDRPRVPGRRARGDEIKLTPTKAGWSSTPPSPRRSPRGPASSIDREPGSSSRSCARSSATTPRIHD